MWRAAAKIDGSGSGGPEDARSVTPRQGIDSRSVVRLADCLDGWAQGSCLRHPSPSVARGKLPSSAILGSFASEMGLGRRRASSWRVELLFSCLSLATETLRQCRKQFHATPTNKRALRFYLNKSDVSLSGRKRSLPFRARNSGLEPARTRRTERRSANGRTKYRRLPTRGANWIHLAM